jgi:hypothetical protein
MLMREMRKKNIDEDDGWDHDELDCPEYGEIIILKNSEEEKN